MDLTGTFGGVFRGTTVLVTGNTGFCGSWLSLWLWLLGARVVGFSRGQPRTPSNFLQAGLGGRVVSTVYGDVSRYNLLRQVIERHRPGLVVHLAAQPLVRAGYESPRETFLANTMGTCNLLEAVRRTSSVRAVLVPTTDKVYENHESPVGYAEGDRLGGDEPYAASKAAAELVAACYRKAFFTGGERRVYLATARAGNIFGGGDWALPRLMPDVMRALLAGVPVPITGSLGATRPWQFVLEPLAGYLCLAAKLLGPDGGAYAEAFNFGPREDGVTVRELVAEVIKCWGSGAYFENATQPIAETQTLRLNSQKAWESLGWRTCLDWRESVAQTVDWYRRYQAQRESGRQVDMFETCAEQIVNYTLRARESGLRWAGG